MSLSCILHVDVFLFINFIGTGNCKTEIVGIEIQNLAFKEPFRNQESVEFKELESSLLSAVSDFKHVFNEWDQMYKVVVYIS